MTRESATIDHASSDDVTIRMVMRIVPFLRNAMRRAVMGIAIVAVFAGCSVFRKEPPRATPLPPGVDPAALYSVAKVEVARPPAQVGKHDILILSGGGAHGAYQGGVVCGWSDAGTMPEFSVVTGVSAGALLAAAVFAGSEYLPEIRRLYTELSQTSLVRGDLWMKKRLYGLGTDSIATTDKLRGHLRRELNNPGYFEKVAAEHAKGRRLYIGTTNLDTQRFVPWDMGAIASEGTPESRKLYEDIVVASCAIPPLLSPPRICVTIDGKPFEEMHVDGFVTRNLFFYPPSDWPAKKPMPRPVASSSRGRASMSCSRGRSGTTRSARNPDSPAWRKHRSKRSARRRSAADSRGSPDTAPAAA